MKTERSTRYEDHAHVQGLAARDLIRFTGALDPRAILEPGCGTGLYSRMLLEAFPAASILAVDLSASRVRSAQRDIVSRFIRFEVADAEEIPFAAYDLISSNATFQWFRNLPRTLARLGRMLSEGGVLSFSFFGPGTYRELDDAMRDVFHGSARVTASGFAGGDTLSAALASCFTRWDMEEKTHVRVFPSVPDLLRSIRFTDTRGTPPGRRIEWTRGTLARIEAAYRERWGCIRSSYQVFLCRGER